MFRVCSVILMLPIFVFLLDTVHDFPDALVTFKTLQILINLVDFLTLQTDDKYPHMGKRARRPCLISLESYDLLRRSSFFKDMQSYFIQ